MVGGLGFLDSFIGLALEHGLPILKMPFPGLGHVVKGGVWEPGPKLIERLAIEMEAPPPLLVGTRHKDDGKRGEICWPQMTSFHHPLATPNRTPSNREFYILTEDEDNLENSERECLWGSDGGTYNPQEGRPDGAISFGRVVSGMDVVDAISRVSSQVVRVSGLPIGPIDVPCLMPVEDVVLKDIQYLSGTPLTRAYKIASLPEDRRSELQNIIDRLSDVMSDELSDELRQKIDSLVTKFMEKS